MVQASVFHASVNSGFSETIAWIQAKFCCGILATYAPYLQIISLFFKLFFGFQVLMIFFCFVNMGPYRSYAACLNIRSSYYCIFHMNDILKLFSSHLGEVMWSFSSVKVQILKMIFKLIDQFPQLTWKGPNFKTNFLINWRYSGGFRKVIIIKTLSD